MVSPVFLVFYAEFGDQAHCFHSVFATRLLAEQYIQRAEPNELWREHWQILEEAVITGL